LRKQIFLIFLLLFFVLSGASCIRNYNPFSLKNGQENNGTTPPDSFVTCPQTDIPWPSLADSPWPMSTVNPQGIARSSYLGPQEGKVLWAIPLVGGATQGGPAIGPDGTIYIGIGLNFYAITQEGNIKWCKEGSETFRIYTGPVVAADSTIYAGVWGFYALRPDGTVKWVFEVDGYFTEIRPLIGIDGTIYIKNFQGIIYALTPDGNLKWQNDMGQDLGISYMVASPDGSTIYAPGRDSMLIALDAGSGVLKWSWKTRLFFAAGPTVDSQGNIYFPGADSTDDKYIYSLDPSGKLRWKFKVKYACNPPYAGINIDKDGQIYFDWGHFGITSLDYSGRLRWQLDPRDAYTDCPIICDSENNLYILSVLGPIVWCYCPDGTLKFSVEVPGYAGCQLFPAAVSKDGIMYFGGNSSWFVAVE